MTRWTLAAWAAIALAASSPALAQKTPTGGGGGGGGSAGQATWTGNCRGDVRYVGVCLGPNGRQGYRALTLSPQQRSSLTVPAGSSYDALCGERPRQQCPGEFPVEVD